MRNRVSKHFFRDEFKCFCCNFATVDVELIEVLEDVRERFRNPVIINSGSRCESHNKSVGGSSNSKHTQGIAADIVVKDVEADMVQRYLINKYPDKYGIGVYLEFTHIDIRSDKARWAS